MAGSWGREGVGEGKVLALPLELAQYRSGFGSVASQQSVAVPVGLVVFLGFAMEGIWRVARHVYVIAHEGAHVVASWSVGRRVTGVVLNSDATGATSTLGPGSGLGVIISGFAGYPGPSLFGLGAAYLITQGYIEALLWLGLIFLAVMLLLVRNIFGIISIILNGALLFLILFHGSAELKVVAAYGLSWFLLFSGVRFAIMHGSSAGDAGILRQIIPVPKFVWSILWLVITVTALWIGAHLLV